MDFLKEGYQDSHALLDRSGVFLSHLPIRIWYTEFHK